MSPASEGEGRPGIQRAALRKVRLLDAATDVDDSGRHLMMWHNHAFPKVSDVGPTERISLRPIPWWRRI